MNFVILRSGQNSEVYNLTFEKSDYKYYNWYERNWRNGQPTKFFQNRDCGCCQIGGAMNAFDDCRYYCTGRSPPKEGK